MYVVIGKYINDEGNIERVEHEAFNIIIADAIKLLMEDDNLEDVKIFKID